MSSSKKSWGFYLEDLETPIGRAVNLAIAILVLLSSIIFVAETYPLQPAVRRQLAMVDSFCLCVFAIEYVLRLWCAENRLRHLFNLYSVLDLIAILPFLIGFF